MNAKLPYALVALIAFTAFGAIPTRDASAQCGPNKTDPCGPPEREKKPTATDLPPTPTPTFTPSPAATATPTASATPTEVAALLPPDGGLPAAADPHPSDVGDAPRTPPFLFGLLLLAAVGAGGFLVARFWARLEEVWTRYTMFLPRGQPTRATVHVSMKSPSKATSKSSGEGEGATMKSTGESDDGGGSTGGGEPADTPDTSILPPESARYVGNRDQLRPATDATSLSAAAHFASGSIPDVPIPSVEGLGLPQPHGGSFDDQSKDMLEIEADLADTSDGGEADSSDGESSDDSDE